MKKRLIFACIILVAGVLLWMFVLTKTFLNVTTTTGEFSVYKNGTIITTQKDGFVYLDKGHYTIAAAKDNKPVAVEYLRTNILPWQTITIAAAKESSALQPQLIIGRDASLITPLGSGYLYKNSTTRGIEYADADGIRDVSGSFGLVAKFISDSNSTYNTVVNIERDDSSGAVYVSTTRAIYKLTSLDHIEQSKFSDLLVTRSSLNTKAHKITFITFSGSGTYSAYSLDTSNIGGALQQVYTGKLLVNQITSNGDYAFLYDDNTPNPSSDTATSYGTKKQIVPRLIKLSTLEPVSVPNLPNTTFVSAAISSDGTYLAYRTKLGDHVTIITIADGKTVATIPATTLTKLTWRDKSLIYNYGATLLSYTPGDSNSSVVLSAPYPITGVTYKHTTPVVSTNHSLAFIGQLDAVNVDASAISLSSSTEKYRIAFSAIDGAMQIYQLCDDYEECETATIYGKTLQQLAKVGDIESATHSVTNEFFTNDYSYAK